jgi:type I restriction enzyme, S subunit
MKSEEPRSWVSRSLGEVAEILPGYAFKSAEFSEDPNDTRLLRGDNIGHGRLRWDRTKRWPADRAADMSRYGLESGDVVLAMDRPWIDSGLKYAVVRKHDLPALLVQRVARLRGGPMLDQGFLRWLIGSAPFIRHVQAVQTGTAVPHISGKQIEEFEFVCPPLEEQRRISRALDSLDRKVELNNGIAESLEGIAAETFRARFSDFVGVEDLEESELGPIPKGWRVAAFSEIVEINPRIRIEKGSEVAFLEMAAVSAWATRPSAMTQRAYQGGAKFERGDTLMARITGCIEHGKGAFVDFLDGPAAGSTEFFVLRPKDPLTPAATFLLSRSQRIREHAIANMTGSSGRQRVPAACFDSLLVAVPPDRDSWREEAEVLERCFEMSHSLWRENQTLIDLRDTLLPKLMSGEIRVPESVGPDLDGGGADAPTDGEELAPEEAVQAA